MLSIKGKLSFLLCLIIYFSISPSNTIAQIDERYKENWIYSPLDRTYTHAIMRIKCPEKIDNFSLTIQYDLGKTNITCRYTSDNKKNLINFFYYPSLNTYYAKMDEEVNSTIKKINPKEKVIYSKQVFNFDNKDIKFNKSEAGPNSDGISSSVIMYEENNHILKIKMSFEGEFSNYVQLINNFGTLQTEAFKNSAMCKNIRTITKNKAKTNTELKVAASELMLYANETLGNNSTLNQSEKCNTFFLKEFGSQKNIILSYSKEGSIRWKLQTYDQTSMPILNLIKSVEENKYSLIGHHNDYINFYYRYDAEPSLEQINNDIQSALNGTLPIIASINAKNNIKQIIVPSLPQR